MKAILPMIVITLLPLASYSSTACDSHLLQVIRGGTPGPAGALVFMRDAETLCQVKKEQELRLSISGTTSTICEFPGLLALVTDYKTSQATPLTIINVFSEVGDAFENARFCGDE